MTKPGMTPRGKPMPRNDAEWEYLCKQYERAMLEMKDENSKLRERANRLEQKYQRLVQKLRL